QAVNRVNAQRILQRVHLVRVYQGVNITSVRPSKEGHCRNDLRVTTYKGKRLVIRGKYSAIWVSGMVAPIKIFTTHGRFGVTHSNDVEATVSDGIIDFMGEQGTVRLRASWEINIKIVQPAFQGTLEAVADGPIRVLLPHGFSTSFIATVPRGGTLVCRADIAEQ